MPQLRDRVRAGSARLPSAVLVAMTGLALVLSGCAPRPDAAGRTVRTAEQDNAHPGKRVFEENCASCHDNPEQSRAPATASLRELNRSTVKYTLELGYMQQQAKNLTPEERAEVIDWLPRDDGKADEWIAKARCPIKLRKVNLDGAPRTVRVTNTDAPCRPRIGAPSRTSTLNVPSGSVMGRSAGSRNAAPVECEYSRAMPRIENAYPRSGVTLTSTAASFRPSSSIASAPTGASMPRSASRRMPSCSSPMPSSRCEAIMPSEV